MGAFFCAQPHIICSSIKSVKEAYSMKRILIVIAAIAAMSMCTGC